MPTALPPLGHAHGSLENETDPLKAGSLCHVRRVGCGLDALDTGMREKIGDQLALCRGAVALATVSGQHANSDFPAQRGISAAPPPLQPLDAAGQFAIDNDRCHVLRARKQASLVKCLTNRVARGEPEPLILTGALDTGEAPVEDIKIFKLHGPELDFTHVSLRLSHARARRAPKWSTGR